MKMGVETFYERLTGLDASNKLQIDKKSQKFQNVPDKVVIKEFIGSEKTESIEIESKNENDSP